MAIGDAYATAATYLAAIDKTDTGENTEIDRDLLAVSRWLDRKLGRFFTKDAAADVTRDFRPEARATRGVVRPYAWQELEIPDLNAVTSIKSDDDGDGTAEVVWTVPGNIDLWPYDATRGPEVRPWRMITINDGAPYAFVPGRLITIEGSWGWPAVPAAIERATCHLTAILRLETPRAQSQVTELDGVMAISPQARNIVMSLAKDYGR